MSHGTPTPRLGLWLVLLSLVVAAMPNGAAAADPTPNEPPLAISGLGPQQPCELLVEYQPQLAVNPTDPGHLVAAWIEGIAGAIVAAASFDGGLTWRQSLVGAGTCSAGTREDPRVAFAADGRTVYIASLCAGECVESPTGIDLVVVRRSVDGGLTWDGLPPAVVASRLSETCADACLNAELALTTHPSQPGTAYLIWSQHNSAVPSTVLGAWVAWPAYVSMTSDGGATWTPPRVAYWPEPGAYPLLHDIRVLGDGRLLDVFVEYAAGYANQRSIESTDGGQTWTTDPMTIGAALDVKAADLELRVKAQAAVKPAFDVAADRTAYVAWQDVEASAIVLRRLPPGATKWSEERFVVASRSHVCGSVRMSDQPFQPMLAARSDGTVAVSYYDFRFDCPGDLELTTTFWLAWSKDRGRSWTESLIGGPFDLRDAAVDPLTPAYLLGEVNGLAAAGDAFLTTFVQSGSASAEPPQDIFFARQAVPIADD